MKMPGSIRRMRRAFAPWLCAVLLLAMAAPTAAQTCPSATDTRYVVGVQQTNTATTAELTWTAGSLTRPAFTFASGFSVTLGFTGVSNIAAGFPAIGNVAGINSLRVNHTSGATGANLSTLNVTTNAPTTTTGFRFEDVDYNAGQFRDRFTGSAGVSYTPVTPANYTITGNTIQANNGVACSGTPLCDVRAAWGAGAATTRTLTYQNGLGAPSGQQFTAYNDFVFCVAQAQLTIRKTWTGAALGDDATVTATRAGTAIATLASNADTASETDSAPAVTVFRGETIGLAETLASGNVGQYISSLACTGTTDTNPSDGLTIGATDTNVVCTYTNARRPTVTVTKVSNGGVGTFAFSGNNGFAAQNITTAIPGTGVAGATQTLTAASTATRITESAPPAGFVLSAISCTGLGAGGTATPTINGSGGGFVDLSALATAPGSNIACTFTNTALGSVTIVKDAVPNSAQDFGFTSTNPSIPAFSLDDDADPALPSTRTFTNLAPGSFTVTETATAGWTLTGLACTDPDNGSSVSPATRTATIDLDAGENITCTFTNSATGIADLQIVKTNNNSAPLVAGTTTTYVLTVTNNGPAAVNGAVVYDTPNTPAGATGPGLNCPAANPVTCSPAAACPAGTTVGNLTGAGVTLGNIANGGAVTLSFSCNVQ